MPVRELLDPELIRGHTPGQVLGQVGAQRPEIELFARADRAGLVGREACHRRPRSGTTDRPSEVPRHERRRPTGQFLEPRITRIHTNKTDGPNESAGSIL